MNEQPAFFIRDIPIHGDTILSPMDGYSDLPFRTMCRRLGSAISYTEFVNCLDVVHNTGDLALRLQYAEWERPITFQIFDDDPERMLEAALILREKDPDIIDVNMGCSDKKVSGRGAGAGLLRKPGKIGEIFRELTDALDIPVSGKIRLGWDDAHLNYVEVARIIEDNGGSLVAVHGRTKAQSYKGEANWAALAEIKRAVSIPVIGNGDVRRVGDIQRMKDYTGVDGVMIARAAIGNPWIFARLNREEVPEGEVRALMLRHLNEMLDFYGAERGLVLFRKHASKYIAPYGLTKASRIQLLTAEQPEEFIAVLDMIMAIHPEPAY
jgi:nifR3 family TIM-barrel protein